MTIRSYKPEDSEALIDLWNRCGLVRPTNDPAKDIDRKMKVSGDLLLVGVADGKLVASAMVGYEGHRGWINYFSVCPTRQKSGLGRLLMDEIERRLRAMGCAKINLQVRNGNVGAMAFYNAIGFKQDDILCFGKRLEHDESPRGNSQK